jgi:hypothetical protein
MHSLSFFFIAPCGRRQYKLNTLYCLRVTDFQTKLEVSEIIYFHYVWQPYRATGKLLKCKFFYVGDILGLLDYGVCTSDYIVSIGKMISTWRFGRKVEVVVVEF